MDEIPVIMISAEDSGETIKRAYSMGVTDYIQRPFDAFIVRRRIENTLKLYANQKRLMKLVSDQIYEKEENNNLMVGILNHVVEFRTHEGEEYNRNIRSATELLLRRLIQKTDSYHLSEEDIVLIKMGVSHSQHRKNRSSGQRFEYIRKADAGRIRHIQNPYHSRSGNSGADVVRKE